MIFKLTWTNEKDPSKTSFMNIVYEITLIEEIAVVLDYSPKVPGNVIDTNKNPTGGLTLFAGESYFLSDPKALSNGLTFRWECTAGNSLMLQQECDKWSGSPVLYIPNSIPEGLGLIGTKIQIGVVVSALEASVSTQKPEL